MAENVFIPLCDCDQSAFIAIPDISESCPPDGVFSEVEYILLSDSTQSPIVAPTDWNLQADWDAVVDNAAPDGTKIKKLIGIGNVTASDPATRIMPAFVEIVGETTYTLTFTLKAITPEIYNFLQNLENCPALPRLWFITVGGYMFGTNDGIVLSKKLAPFVLNEGQDSYEEYQLILSWKAKTRPERIVSPI
jgi:hypothetical protein